MTEFTYNLVIYLDIFMKLFFNVYLTVLVISGAVRKNILTRQETDDRIENVIKDWLKYASDRDGGRKKKRKNAEGNQQEPNGLPQ